jgi:nucleoside-diphosphate-sugar epimerase
VSDDAGSGVPSDPAAGVSRERFDAAARAAADQLQPLRGAAIHVSGASGFLASNLLALLHAASRTGDLGLRLFASARRPPADVPVFDFLGLTPEISWEIAPVERSSLPPIPGLVAIHAASFGAPGDYMREPVATFRANTDGLFRVYEQAVRAGGGHVVYFSSAEVYGQPPDASIPTPEAYDGAPDLAAPRSIYGESKRMAEVLGAVLARQHGIPFTALRPFNLYGPGQRLGDGRVPMEFIRLALDEGAVTLQSDGSATRSPCFVWDGLLQVIACLRPGAAAQAFNIGNPSAEITMLDLARSCAAAAGIDPQAVSAGAASGGALARAVPDVARVLRHARPALPEPTPLEDGLATLRAWVSWLRDDA